LQAVGVGRIDGKRLLATQLRIQMPSVPQIGKAGLVEFGTRIGAMVMTWVLT